MERVYYVLDRVDNYYLLNCASYGFSDDEELMSSTNNIIYKGNKELIINKYVHFENEIINKNQDYYYVDGEVTLLENDISDLDRKEYDERFDESILAYKDNNQDGINKWNEYLKSYENKFMNFREINYYEKKQIMN